MSKTTVTFNGVNLNDLFVVSDLVRPFMMRTIETTEVDGRDGAIYRSARYNQIDITMRLTFLSEDKNERVMALANLVKVLDVDEPTPLYISDDNGWYYLAIPKGGDISRWVGAESFPLTFTCPDPARYGEEVDREIAASTNPRVNAVGGNIETWPVLTFTAQVTNIARPLIVPFYGNSLTSRIEEGTRLVLTFPSTGTWKVTVDTETRSVTAVKGATSVLLVPDVTTVFRPFKPGYDYLTAEGPSLSMRAKYHERWL